MKNLFKTISASLLVGSLLFACTEDYFDFDKMTYEEWRPEFAVPLINTSLTLEDIIIKSDSGGLINTNADGILEVIYESSVLNTLGNRAYEVPAQNFTDTFTQTIPAFNPGIPITIDQSIELDFQDSTNSGIIIDSMLLKQGLLALTLENEFPYDIDIIAKFRTFTDANGDTLNLNYNIPAATSARPIQVRSETRDLTGYKINLTQDANGNPAENKIPIDLKIIVNLVTGVGATNGEEIRLSSSISNIKFKEFFGYLGNSIRELEKDTFNVELFKNFTSSNFFISNPTLNVTVFNSFAVPINFDFLFLKAIIDKKNEVLPFDIPSTLQPLVLNSPTKYGREITNIQLDRNNSNLDTILSSLLNKIAFDSEIQFNPNGVPAAGQPRNFLTDTSDIGLDVQFVIPFEGRAAGFFIEDTVDFNFEIADDLSNGLIRVIAQNGFPMKVAFQLTFLDSANNQIDQLFPAGLSSLVPSSIVGANGETIAESEQKTDIEISGDRLKKLTAGRKVAIKAQLNTTEASQQKNVKFKTDYRLGLSLGLKAGILID